MAHGHPEWVHLMLDLQPHSRESAYPTLILLRQTWRTLHASKQTVHNMGHAPFIPLARPHLEYVVPVWDPHSQKSISTTIGEFTKKLYNKYQVIEYGL